MTGNALLVKIVQARRNFEVVFTQRVASPNTEGPLSCDSIITELGDIHVYRNIIVEALVDSVFFWVIL